MAGFQIAARRNFGRLVCLFALCFLKPGAAIAFDFRGLVLGEKATSSEVEEKLRIPCEDGQDGGTICNGTVRIAGSLSDLNVVIGADRVVRRVLVTNIDPDNFEDIRDELARKFGAPKSQKRSAVQNSFGAQFQQLECVWTDKKGRRISFDKYGGSLRTSMLYFSTAQEREQFKATHAGAKGEL